MTILKEWADEVGEKGRAGLVDSLPGVLGYSVGAKGGGSSRFSKRS